MTDGSVKSIPSLKTLVPIGNSMLGNSMPTSTFHSGEVDMIMDKEFYNIEIEFTVQETQTNLEHGNMYLTSKVMSFNPGQLPVTFHRIGHVKHKSNIFV